MIKSKDYYLSQEDIDDITDVIEHLTLMLKHGVRHDSMHYAWADYYRLAQCSFRRMCHSIDSSCDVEEGK